MRYSLSIEYLKLVKWYKLTLLDIVVFSFELNSFEFLKSSTSFELKLYFDFIIADVLPFENIFLRL